mmetsp:Transcript_11951/g.20250  ORF Transcript_11951/g.20250 Transcript_11951/m.20250 type:complete len:119 (-) Transcript_11951:52-408(-)
MYAYAERSLRRCGAISTLEGCIKIMLCDNSFPLRELSFDQTFVTFEIKTVRYNSGYHGWTIPICCAFDGFHTMSTAELVNDGGQQTRHTRLINFKVNLQRTKKTPKVDRDERKKISNI